MCGINYSKVEFKNIKFSFLKSSFKIIELLKIRDLKSALELAKKLRNNYVFIEIVKKNKLIIDELNKILLLIKKIEKNNYHNEFDIINDLKWIIESELFFKVKRIVEFSKKHQINLNESV